MRWPGRFFCTVRLLPAAVALLAVLAGAPPGRAQEERAEEPLDAGTTARLAGAGILGGTIGLVSGLYLGAVMSGADDAGEDLDWLSGAVAGAAVGEGLLLPLGVHLANGGEGSWTEAAVASLGIAALGLLALEAVHYDPPGAPVILVAVPLSQLAASIAIERATD